ncbi:hypothetical protein [Streptomyces sp. VRA16 Mangrove soil]|uniref:hypothetical protein n=1 Tax=Streptomyces sp. VRA16 Mangrove soil TaxID=2817434 RepID=UPI001A9D9C6D|nr:hypothetical protein [Streptomyces sp. VRA16 Mangrove soil]MBO1330157.1 hypothetical protein [Streptomyces sp. VRA16 Mangrove soil]
MTISPQVAPNVSASTAPRTTTLTAVWDAVLVRGVGVMSVSRFGPGQYIVFFHHDVSQGAYVATLGSANTVAFMPPGEIVVSPAENAPNAVVVLTFGSGGLPFQDRGFHLAVHLP